MSDELEESIRNHFAHVLAALPDDLTFPEWFADGAKLDVFDHGADSHDEAVFAVGYLHGAADVLGMNMHELLHKYGLVN